MGKVQRLSRQREYTQVSGSGEPLPRNGEGEDIVWSLHESVSCE
jgi:hypothetical protein